MEMTAPADPAEILWIRRIGDCVVRWYAPPHGVEGAFPYVAAEDVVALLLPPAAAVANYLAMACRKPEVGAMEIVSDDGPLLIVPHEHAKAVLLVGIDIELATRFELGEYLDGAESAWCIYLAPMSDAQRNAWFGAFEANRRRAGEGAWLC